MLAKLRSRGVPAILAGVVVFALVAAGAVGVINSFFADDAAPEPQEQTGQNTPEDPSPPPGVDTIGDPPDQISYDDVGQNCQTGECYRIVAITADDGSDGAESVDAIYDHLLDQDWGQVDPSGGDPSEMSADETILTDGNVMIQGSSQPHAEAPDAAGFLILAHAEAPEQ